MVELQFSKLIAGVRFSYPAPEFDSTVFDRRAHGRRIARGISSFVLEIG